MNIIGTIIKRPIYSFNKIRFESGKKSEIIGIIDIEKKKKMKKFIF